MQQERTAKHHCLHLSEVVQLLVTQTAALLAFEHADQPITRLWHCVAYPLAFACLQMCTTEVADAISFLASSRSSYITGIALEVAGKCIRFRSDLVIQSLLVFGIGLVLPNVVQIHCRINMKSWLAVAAGEYNSCSSWESHIAN